MYTYIKVVKIKIMEQKTIMEPNSNFNQESFQRRLP